jgi:hypothetical protein
MVSSQFGDVVEDVHRLSSVRIDLKGEIGVADILQRLLIWLDRHGVASYDYADILRSRAVRGLTFGNRFAQQVAIQFGKHFPFNIRPVLGVTPHVSSQTLALLCSARAWQCAAGWPGATIDTVRQSAQALLDDRLGKGYDALWGMKLHFATRFVRVTPTTPNLFQTTNAIHALLDAFQVTGEETYAQAADEAVMICVERLGIVASYGVNGDCTFCRYYPGMETPVYNVNALLAAASWRLSILAIGDASTHADRAESLLRFVLSGQRPTGAWPYASHPSGQWVDGYHTGYVLEGLGYFQHSALAVPVESALERGAAYFRRQLMDIDGCPKYFDNSRYPIDVQNCAQAIQTIARLQPYGGLDLVLLQRAVTCAVRELFVADAAGGGYFAATRRRWFVNRTPYVRWGQAPMALALTFAWRAERGDDEYFRSGHVLKPDRCTIPGQPHG